MASASKTELFVGLMSGTSLNSIDCVLVSFDPHLKMLSSLEYPIDETLRTEILNLCSAGGNEIQRMGQLDRELGLCFAEAVLSLLNKNSLKPEQIFAIGSHGQTIRHEPNNHEKSHAFTLQIGDPNTIAAQTGITTVSDFRRRDIALGGQGAPLAPAFHDFAFSTKQTSRCIVNIGGMANITQLSASKPILGFDTGPGNVLIDIYAQRCFGVAFDKNGALAEKGKVCKASLKNLLGDPFFNTTPPKSTGRELFNEIWAAQSLSPSLEANDILATLTELTAKSVSDAIDQHCDKNSEIFVCGGGAHNHYLLERLEQLLQRKVESTDALGLPPDWVEAAAFAWLAKKALNKQAIHLESITGSKKPVHCGAVYFA